MERERQKWRERGRGRRKDKQRVKITEKEKNEARSSLHAERAAPEDDELDCVGTTPEATSSLS